MNSLLRRESFFYQGLNVLLLLFIIGMFTSIVLLQLAAILFLISTGLVLNKKSRTKTIHSLDVLLVLYVISGVMSVLLSSEPVFSSQALMRHVVLLSLIPVSYILKESEHFTPLRLSWLVAGLGALSGACGILHTLQGYERTAGFFGGYFTLASLLVFSLPVTIGVFSAARGRIKWMAGFSALLQLSAVWFTYTRSAYLALIIGFCAAAGIWFLLFRKRFNRNHLIQIAVLLVIPIAVVLLILNSNDPRINPLANTLATGAQAPRNETKITDITSGRAQIISDAGEALSADWRQHRWGKLLFGHGLRSRQILVESPFTSWESDYLEVLMNQGFVGLLLTIGLYGLLLYRIRGVIVNTKNETDFPLFLGFEISAMGYWIMSFFTLQMQNITNSSYLVILMAVLVHLDSEPK